MGPVRGLRTNYAKQPFLNGTKPTFDHIRNVSSVEMYGNQASRIILYFPFVVNNIFQFNFGTTVIMLAGASNHSDIRFISFIAMNFVVGFKNTIVKENCSNSIAGILCRTNVSDREDWEIVERYLHGS